MKMFSLSFKTWIPTAAFSSSKHIASCSLLWPCPHIWVATLTCPVCLHLPRPPSSCSLWEHRSFALRYNMLPRPWHILFQNILFWVMFLLLLKSLLFIFFFFFFAIPNTFKVKVQIKMFFMLKAFLTIFHFFFFLSSVFQWKFGSGCCFLYVVFFFRVDLKFYSSGRHEGTVSCSFQWSCPY